MGEEIRKYQEKAKILLDIDAFPLFFKASQLALIINFSPMQESKVITLIRALSPKHRKSFKEFVDNPFFNKHEKTREILEQILNQIEKGTAVLERKQLFSSVFSHQPFDEQRLFNLMSYVKKLLIRFLAYQYLSEQEIEEELLALKAAKYFNQFELLENRGLQFAKYLNSHQESGLSNGYFQYQLNYLLSSYDFNQFDHSKSMRHQKMLDSLDRFFLLHKLKICTHLYKHQHAKQISYDFGFFEEMLSYYERNSGKFKLDTAIEYYYTALRLHHDRNPRQAFEQLKGLMLHNSFYELAIETKKDIFELACDFCRNQIKNEAVNYQKDLLLLYKLGVKNDFFLENGMFPEYRFKEIINLGCHLNEFDWTEAFIKKYKVQLPIQGQDNAYRFNLGYLFYYKRRFDKAIGLLQGVKLEDINYYTAVNLLLLQIYYLKCDLKALLPLIENFRLYILRSKEVSISEKKSYNNLFRYLKKLIKLKYGKTIRDKAQALKLLKEKIRNNQHVRLKSWLLEEIVEV